MTELVRLGLDINSPDERIINLLAAFSDPSEEWGQLKLRTVAESFNRLVGAIDLEKSSNGVLELLPFEQISEVGTCQYSVEAARVFTEGNEIEHEFPTKARRTVTDPKSPFYGFTVTYDDWPETFDGIDGLVNTSFVVPTFRLSRETVMQIDVNNRSLYDRDPNYMPPSVRVQGRTKGQPTGGQYTTEAVTSFTDLLNEQAN